MRVGSSSNESISIEADFLCSWDHHHHLDQRSIEAQWLISFFKINREWNYQHRSSWKNSKIMSETISIETQRLIGFLCGCDHKHQSRVGSSPSTENESILIDRKCDRQQHCKSDNYIFMQVRSSTSSSNHVA